MLVLVQRAQQTDEEILGMSFNITIILSVLHRVLSPIQIMRMPTYAIWAYYESDVPNIPY